MLGLLGCGLCTTRAAIINYHARSLLVVVVETVSIRENLGNTVAPQQEIPFTTRANVLPLLDVAWEETSVGLIYELVANEVGLCVSCSIISIVSCGEMFLDQMIFL